jgi:hypothetical protein
MLFLLFWAAASFNKAGFESRPSPPPSHPSPPRPAPPPTRCTGAQTVQIFDSWAAQLAPADYDVFAGPYVQRIIADVRAARPGLPLIFYVSNSGALVERMAAAKPDVISLCHTVDLAEGVARAGKEFAYQARARGGAGGWCRGRGAWFGGAVRVL